MNSRTTRLLALVAIATVGTVSGCGAAADYGHASYAGEAESAGMAYEQSADTYALTPETPRNETSQETMATFSLDVDTASYTRMRQAIHSGSLPAPASVRAEEYINFFRWSEHAPQRGNAPFGVSLESAPSPFGAEGLRLLRVGVQAMSVPADQRPAANLVFLVDVSGSMRSPNKMDLVRYSLTTLVNTLRPDDTVGIVTYAGQVATLIEPTPVTQRGALLAAIETLRSGGSTNGEGGIRRAYDLAAQHFQQGGINRVIIASDGDFNVGLTGGALIELIEDYRDRDITLTTLGFGTGNDRDMERLADHGNGVYAYIDNRREAMRMLQTNLAGSLQVVAKDVKVQLEFDPEIVESFRLIGYDNRVLEHQEFADDAVDAGDIGSGHFATAYVEYTLRDGVDTSDPRNFVEVRVRYKEPAGDESQLLEFTSRVADGHSVLTEASAQFRFGAAVAEFAEILRGSEFSSDRRFAEVRELAEGARWDQGEDSGEFIALVERAGQLSEHH